jgi:hypothetical protein
MQNMLEGIIEEAQRLPLAQQLTLIERLARSIHMEFKNERALHEELAAWDTLSDEALANLAKRV